MKDLISIKDLSKQDIDGLIKEALELKRELKTDLLKNTKIASLFFENSTRTRVSSETAVTDLGGQISGFAGSEGTSVQKGEPLIDSIRMFQVYGYKAIFMRHGLEGSARLAADNSNVPIINGGDGSNNHPTQTLLDLMTILDEKGTIDGLKIALIGDLKYGRTVHSLLQALEKYNVEVWLISPPNLKMQEWRINDYKEKTNRTPIITEDLERTIKEVDVLYVTRIQRERFEEGPEGEIEYKKVSGIYKINKESLKDAKRNMIILHPLPRFKHNLEISIDVDNTPYAKYIEQAKNGVFMRQAILLKVFGDGFEDKEIGETNEKLWKEVEITNGAKKGENFLYRLRNGTLIDHIECGKGTQVLKVLGMENYKNTPLIQAKNIKSISRGKKDVIGFQDKELTEKELSKVSLVTNTTVNIIREGKVFKKGKVVLPKKLCGLIQCQNPKCITNPLHSEHAQSIFHVEDQEPLRVRCHYCETPMSREEIRLIS